MKILGVLLLLLPTRLVAQETPLVPPAGWADDPPALGSLVAFAKGESDLRVVVTRYLQDVQALERRYPVRSSPVRLARLRATEEGWRQRLEELDFAALDFEGQVDYVALRNRIDYDLGQLKLEEGRGAEIAPLLPFAERIRLLQEQRLDRVRVDPAAAGKALAAIAKETAERTKALKEEATKAGGLVKREGITPVIAMRAAEQVAHLREVLADWNRFYDGYDPLYTWWAHKPFTDADAALKAYGEALKEHLAGAKPGEKAPIVGDPALAAGLQTELALAMIPYTPEELLALGERELAWTEEQLKIVSRRMGHGDDWKAALEDVKNQAPPPGEAPWAIFEIARYSEDFIARQHSITLAPLAREVWRLAMQTPEDQLVNPFFSGGEVTHLSYPSDAMAMDDRLMSQRGNTPSFNFPTVQHELIPGHHLQGFVTSRFNGHRAWLNDTPFWYEGWSLYWELRLWDQDFARSDADRIGMLFWRRHRAARIVFSLKFHLGHWTPQQAVDFLVERVGHERANAEAEVRRTARDSPLYQCAYLLGALQLRSLYQELVESGKMSAVDFHDAVMLGGPMPIELVRARLLHQTLTKDYRSQWRFDQGNGAKAPVASAAGKAAASTPRSVH